MSRIDADHVDVIASALEEYRVLNPPDRQYPADAATVIVEYLATERLTIRPGSRDDHSRLIASALEDFRVLVPPGRQTPSAAAEMVAEYLASFAFTIHPDPADAGA
ncbi:hypothetical protein ABZ605_08450 [Streptomyces sp. NPDC012765]|uniref:hypothetical protein n=1 Tax=Streptomyces sp. NPDC012765 TaxID=3155249 RepID=UPI0033C9535D